MGQLRTIWADSEMTVYKDQKVCGLKLYSDFDPSSISFLMPTAYFHAKTSNSIFIYLLFVFWEIVISYIVMCSISSCVDLHKLQC